MELAIIFKFFYLRQPDLRYTILYLLNKDEIKN
jgi:TnpA family transposase